MEQVLRHRAALQLSEIDELVTGMKDDSIGDGDENLKLTNRRTVMPELKILVVHVPIARIS
jgi:hypothetical protein